MKRVTTDKFQKEFAAYKDNAHGEAAVTTSRDQDDVALISADEYKRLRQPGQQAVYAHELPETVINELGTVPISEESLKFDDEYHQT